MPGFVHNSLLRYQDHWNTVCYLWKHPGKTSTTISRPGGRQLDWPSLHRQADRLYRAHSSNNEARVLDNEKWDSRLRGEMLLQRNALSDEAFLRTLEKNKEWIDLELVFRELTELGSRPLLLSMPIHGGWYDRCGVTYEARTAYYQKLRGMSARYHIPLVDFADHDADRSFCHDHMGHPSPNGLVYCSQAVDGFFRRRKPHAKSEAHRASTLATRGQGTREAGVPSPAGSLVARQQVCPTRSRRRRFAGERPGPEPRTRLPGKEREA